MATDRALTANFTVGTTTLLTSASTGASRTISFQDLKWMCLPVLNIDASASDTVSTGIRGAQVCFFEGNTSADICYPVINVVTGVVTFTGSNSDCDGRLFVGVKS